MMGTLLRRLSYVAILGFPLAVLGKRLGWFDFGVAFSILTYSLYLSLAVFVLGLLVFLWKRKGEPQQSRAAFIAALLCLIPLLGIGSQIVKGKKVPPIHNISTDTVNPPQFNEVVALRSSKDNPLDYDAEKLADVQQQAYPQVRTLVQAVSADEAYDRALSIAKKMGWKIVSQDKAAGIIEATETTLIWAFKDDVVVRVKPQGSQVTIDLRSVSRIGLSDLGANAKRINAFLDAFGR